MSKRRYSKTEYFEFLYDFAFTSDKYYELAKVLHSMDYIWYNKMDENRMYDGIEIRKYYLSDDLGYMPDEIDEYDEYIFPSNPSVLEVLVGFSNGLCRDILNWKVSRLMKVFLENLEIDDYTDKQGVDKDMVIDLVTLWMDGGKSIFGEDVPKSTDLWSQAAIWMQDL